MHKKYHKIIIFFSLVLFCLISKANAGEIYQKLGQKIDLKLDFTNQDGQKETIQDMLKGQDVLIITLNYYRCTTMCTVQFANLAAVLKEMNWPFDSGYRVATISFDPSDTQKDAKEKQSTWQSQTGKPEALWDFYVGDAKNIKKLTEELNFYYEKDGTEFSHTAALIFIKPDGTFYRYLYGIVYEPQDLKSALIETSDGKIGSMFQKLYTKYFKTYHPLTGKY